MHTTFQRHHTPGKRARLREEGLWKADSADYFAAERLLAYRNGVRAYVAALNAAAVAPMPHLLQHFHAMAYQIAALRDAFALARALNRTLVRARWTPACVQPQPPSPAPRRDRQHCAGARTRHGSTHHPTRILDCMSICASSPSPVAFLRCTSHTDAPRHLAEGHSSAASVCVAASVLPKQVQSDLSPPRLAGRAARCVVSIPNNMSVDVAPARDDCPLHVLPP